MLDSCSRIWGFSSLKICYSFVLHSWSQAKSSIVKNQWSFFLLWTRFFPGSACFELPGRFNGGCELCSLLSCADWLLWTLIWEVLNIDLLKAVSFELVLGVLCSVLLSKVNLHESVVAYLQLPDWLHLELALCSVSSIVLYFKPRSLRFWLNSVGGFWDYIFQLNVEKVKQVEYALTEDRLGPSVCRWPAGLSASDPIDHMLHLFWYTKLKEYFQGTTLRLCRNYSIMLHPF